jgi:hypothetical protein
MSRRAQGMAGQDDKVAVDAAVSASSNPHDFTLQLQQSGIVLPS